jgi:competence protein ComGC
MNENSNSDHLEGLIQDTTDNIREQQEKGEALAAKQNKTSRTKPIFLLVSLVVLSVIFFIQYPRIIAPYELPDPNTNPIILESELILLSEAIEAYRLEQGQYPDSIDMIKTTPGIDQNLISSKNSNLSYLRKQNSYIIEWKQYTWHGKLNSESGEIKITPLHASK